MIKFNKKYFFVSMGLFILEIFIEKTTGFIRYTLGDFFAVILVYTLIKSFFNISVLKASLLALAIAFTIEFLQLSSLQNYYPEKYKKTVSLMLGTSFSVGDLIAYTLGMVYTLFVEYHIKNFSLKKEDKK